MKPNSKPVIIFILILLGFITIRINIGTIFYYNDCLGGFFLRTFGDPGKKNTITIINPALYKNMAASYRNLPEGFFHSCGILYYRASSKKTVQEIADLSIRYTDYFQVSELARDMIRGNGISGNSVERNGTVIIPNPLPSYTVSIKPQRKPKITYTRGIYFTGYTSGSRAVQRLIPQLKEYGINTVVFDAKDVTGIVNYRSGTEYVRAYNTDKGRTIDNIRMFLRSLRENNITIIARVALFHDQLLYARDPSLAIQSRRTGKPWRGGKELWCDPTSKKVQDYNIAIAEELADLGVDEIQFDYIRFPTSGDLGDAKFSYTAGKMSNEEVISAFLERAYKKISSKNTLLSIDIFGVVAWGKSVDIVKTGQKIEMLYKFCDVISPMIYPSHFESNFDDRDNPADHPYYFIYEGCKKVLNLAGNGVVVRPWLQAFKWRVTDYNARYIHDQIKGADDSGGFGYLFWNASNNYDVVFEAMRSLKKQALLK